MNSSELDALWKQSVAYEEARDWQRAAEGYQQIISSNSSRRASAHINLGTILYNLGDLGEAEKHYRKAIALNPQYALAWFDLGNVMDESQQQEQAVLVYQQAIRLAPDYADAYYNLAIVYGKLKEFNKAFVMWHAYLKRDSTSPWAGHALRQLALITPHVGIQISLTTVHPERTPERAKLFIVPKGE